ncbi:unnamed protein product, partial [Ectocarpus sp. 12 AP-2014]
STSESSRNNARRDASTRWLGSFSAAALAGGAGGATTVATGPSPLQTCGFFPQAPLTAAALVVQLLLPPLPPNCARNASRCHRDWTTTFKKQLFCPVALTSPLGIGAEGEGTSFFAASPGDAVP